MTTLNLQVTAATDDGFFEHSGSTCTTVVLVTVGALFGVFEWDGLTRFLNVTIPVGSIINSSFMTLVPRAGASNGLVERLIRAEDADNPPTFGVGNCLAGRVFTTANVPWDSDLGAFVGTPVNSPDITPVVQEYIDRPLRVSGDAMVIVIFSDNPAQNDFDNFTDFDLSPPSAPRLTIDFNPRPALQAAGTPLDVTHLPRSRSVSY